MDEIINSMIEALEKYDAGFVSISVGKYTFMITDDEQGAKFFQDAWDSYLESGGSDD